MESVKDGNSDENEDVSLVYIDIMAEGENPCIKSDNDVEHVSSSDIANMSTHININAEDRPNNLNKPVTHRKLGKLEIMVSGESSLVGDDTATIDEAPDEVYATAPSDVEVSNQSIVLLDSMNMDHGYISLEQDAKNIIKEQVKDNYKKSMVVQTEKPAIDFPTIIISSESSENPCKFDATGHNLSGKTNKNIFQ